jgi:transposase-like protein
MKVNPVEEFRLAPIKSIIEFMDRFSTNQGCLDYLRHLKWAEHGWKCQNCGSGNWSYIKTRNLVQCKECRVQESVISNTVMRKTRKQIRHWFWAIYAVATQKNGMSGMDLKRQLNMGSYETAWTWLQKIRLAMVSPMKEKLDFDVEVDESYLFHRGHLRGRDMGTGRGSGKAIVVCAVEVEGNGDRIRSGKVSLRHIRHASAKNLHSFIKDHVYQGSVVRTDGWKGYSGLNELGYIHRANILKKPEDAAKKLPRVHRVFANLKTWLRGTHRWVSKKHLQNYLNEYSIRYNNRDRPIEVFNDILRLVAFNEPRTYRGFVEPRKPVYPNPKNELI